MAQEQRKKLKRTATDSWGRKLQIMYFFPHMVQKYFMFRAFKKVPFSLVNAITTPIGTLIAKLTNRKMDKIFKDLIPRKILTEKRLKKWKIMVGQYAVNLFIEITLFLSNHRYQYFKYNRIEGFNHIEQALQQKKGVLVPSIHMGEFLHILSTLMMKRVVIDGKKQAIHTVGLASVHNQILYTEFTNTYEHMHMVIAEDFKTVEQKVSEFLRQNCVVFILVDYSKPSHFRVPFIYDYPATRYLYPMPQLITHLHYTYGSPIVPAIVIPKKDIAHSLVKFIGPLDVKEPLQRLEGRTQEPYLSLLNRDIELIRNDRADKKIKNGVLSLKLHRLLYPYVLKAPYYWEEILNYQKRLQLELKIEYSTTYPELLFSVCGELEKIIDNSYEPGRKDKELKRKLLEIRSLCEQTPDDEGTLKTPLKNKKIDLSKLSTTQAISKVVNIVASYKPLVNSLNLDRIHTLFISLSQP